MAVKFKPWTPWGTPPADRYDPSLDAQLEASGRGFGDLVTDAGTANQRDLQDYGFGKDDLEQARTRGLADIGTQRTQGTEDYHRNVGLLQRSYAQLGNQQAGGFRLGGVAGGGAALAAARKRAENQAVDRQPLDTGFQRMGSALDTETTRLNENTDQSLGRLGVNLQRGVDDRSLQLLRGGREQTFFGLDTATAKASQAAATGWDPGARPANEFVGPQGAYHTIVHGNQTLGVGPGGDVLFKRPRKRP